MKELVKITKYKDGTLKILLEKNSKNSNLSKELTNSFRNDLNIER